MNFDPRYQVKQFVGEVHGRWGYYRVFETGDAKFYLFDCVDAPGGCSTGLQFPVEKRRLKPGLARAVRGAGGRCVERA